jgi:hypothetical protein
VWQEAKPERTAAASPYTRRTGRHASLTRTTMHTTPASTTTCSLCDVGRAAAGQFPSHDRAHFGCTVEDMAPGHTERAPWAWRLHRLRSVPDCLEFNLARRLYRRPARATNKTPSNCLGGVARPDGEVKVVFSPSRKSCHTHHTSKPVFAISLRPRFAHSTRQHRQTLRLKPCPLAFPRRSPIELPRLCVHAAATAGRSCARTATASGAE